MDDKDQKHISLHQSKEPGGDVRLSSLHEVSSLIKHCESTSNKTNKKKHKSRRNVDGSTNVDHDESKHKPLQENTNDPQTDDTIHGTLIETTTRIKSSQAILNESVSKVQSPEGDSNDTEIKDNDRDIQSESQLREKENHEEPIPSGTGSVSKDCSASDLLGWSEILPKWHSKLHQRPKGLDSLVRNGIPEPLRGEVWQLLSGAHEHQHLMDEYRIYLTKEATTEQIILRDVHRTYPAHVNFNSDTNDPNSLIDSLYKVCKAYAVYDLEIGYCQGLSFLVAALLLHMPEEQAFCVIVRIMEHYGLRNLFKNNFDELYLKFYQLEHLLKDQIPDLHQHFQRIGLEPFTYASQWFLTVFTAKFPLNAVFHIMDIFLLDGMDTIFQIALALLKLSKHELLESDFEGVFKFFRVSMPKRYMNQEHLSELINVSVEINLKRLNKYKKEYEIVKQKEKMLENPLIRLQKENAKLTENNLRLERENDDLARDLVASKIQLRAQLDVVEDRYDNLKRALVGSQLECKAYLSNISDIEDEKARLEVEVSQLKEVCRRELNRVENELTRDNNIIADYKRICSQLSKRLDNRIDFVKQYIDEIDELIFENDVSNDKSCHAIYKTKTREFMNILLSDEDFVTNDNQHACNRRTSSDRTNSINESDITSNSSTTSHESSQKQHPVGAYIKSDKGDTKVEQLLDHIDQLEVELARTKLALVEAECKCQQLIHDLNLGATIKTSPNLNLKKASSKTASSALAKFNNLIGEKLSIISNPYMDQVTGSSSSISTIVSTNYEPSSPTHLAKTLQKSERIHNSQINNDFDNFINNDNINSTSYNSSNNRVIPTVDGDVVVSSQQTKKLNYPNQC